MPAKKSGCGEDAAVKTVQQPDQVNGADSSTIQT
jgi:hypothetical protein